MHLHPAPAFRAPLPPGTLYMQLTRLRRILLALTERVLREARVCDLCARLAREREQKTNAL